MVVEPGIDVRARAGDVEVHLCGDIDLAFEQELLAALRDVALFGLPVVVDMADVTFLDSTGMRCLLVAQRCFEDAGLPLRLRAVPPHVRRVLEIAGVGQTLPIIA